MMKLVSVTVVGLALLAIGCGAQPARPPETPQPTQAIPPPPPPPPPGSTTAGVHPGPHDGPWAQHGAAQPRNPHDDADRPQGPRREERAANAGRGRPGQGRNMRGMQAGQHHMGPGPDGEQGMMRELAMLGVHFYPPPMLVRRAKEIGLTPDQVTKIRQEMFATQTRAIDFHAKLEHTKVEVARLLSADKIDERAVNAQIDEAAKAQAEMHKLNVGTMLHVRGLLTAEQRQKLDERKPPQRPGAKPAAGAQASAGSDDADDDDDDSDDDDADG